jgi:Na+-transporting NADH:ubiquinone oxidoreductase subunit NqrB
MSKFKELIKSPHIHIALATGLSIIVMAYVSKKILAEPMGAIPLSIPPFLMLLYESLSGRYKNSRIMTTWYWILAITGSAVLIILIYVI